MPVYAYKGFGPTGKTVSGIRDADSPKGLRQLMRKDGVIVTEVDLSKGGKKESQTKKSLLNRDVKFGDLFGGIKKNEIAAFTRQLATLLRAGIPLADALGALFEQEQNERFKSNIGEVRTAVNEGAALADAISRHPAVFDNLFVSMVRAGEQAGNLEEVLTRLADFMGSSAKLKAKLQGAMIYPVIMVLVMTGIIGVLMVAVIPRITQLFEQQDKVLPMNTQFLIWVSHITGQYWYVLAILIGLTVVLFRRWSRSETGRPKWHAFVLRVPRVGSLTRRVAIERFCRTLGTMLHAGVPMLKSLDTAKEILGNVVLQAIIDDAKIAVTEGESLAVALKRSGEFPTTVTQMIAVGERAGQLETMLLQVADAYDAEVNMELERLTAILEPLLLVGMGGAVAFIVFSILMPIMDMSQLPGG
ncbi:MAG TPA: type II secretion system inner membrane protein GspF [Kofleriaceae bacterium]|nr:type II secretion system inner membrane protein GspF [Kofleriaceae bacterium]